MRLIAAAIIATFAAGVAAVADPGGPADATITAAPAVADPYVEENHAVAVAINEARQLGFSVCTPEVVDVDYLGHADETIAAWAEWPEMFDACRIGVRPDLEDPAVPGYVHEVAEHEVCHLVTGPSIQAMQGAGAYDTAPAGHDPYHEGLFLSCVEAMSRR